MHSIYKWFVGLYHENLYKFLAGFDCEDILNQTNQFNGVIGIVTIAVVLVIALLYYFLRHARFNGIISWLIVLGVVAFFSWGYGFGIVKSQLNDMPNYVVYGIENCYLPDGTEEYAEEGEDATVDEDEISDEKIESDEEEFDAPEGGCNSLQPQQDAQPMITTQTFVGFGFANMFIGMIWFLLFSILLKRFSPSCRHTPWPSIWPKH